MTESKGKSIKSQLDPRWHRLAPALRHLMEQLPDSQTQSSFQIDWRSNPFLAPLGPLLQQAPPELGLPRVPAGHESSTGAYYYNTALHLGQQATLGDVLGALAASDVPVIIFKGAYLIPLLYPTEGLRWAQDVDLIVPHGQLQDAHETLSQLGYECEFPDDVMLAQAQSRRFYYAEADYVRPKRPGMKLDLHWHVIHTVLFRAATALDVDGMWERAIPVRIANRPALTMAPEDTLLHLCYHLTVQHHLRDLRGYLDIDQFVRRFQPDLDWATFVSRTEASYLKCAVYFAFHFCTELLGTPVPAEVLQGLRPPRRHPSWVAAWKQDPRRWLACLPLHRQAGQTPGVPGGPVYELLMVDSLGDLVRVMKVMVAPALALLRARDGLPESASALRLYLGRLRRIGRWLRL